MLTSAQPTKTDRIISQLVEQPEPGDIDWGPTFASGYQEAIDAVSELIRQFVDEEIVGVLNARVSVEMALQELDNATQGRWHDKFIRADNRLDRAIVEFIGLRDQLKDAGRLGEDVSEDVNDVDWGETHYDRAMRHCEEIRTALDKFEEQLSRKDEADTLKGYANLLGYVAETVTTWVDRISELERE